MTNAPIDLNEPPTDPETLGTEVEIFLEQFQSKDTTSTIPGHPELRSRPGPAPYIHPRLISFHNEQDLINWQDYMPDARSRSTFSHFAGPKNTCKNNFKAGVFSVPNGSIVGDLWKTRDWHVFAIAIIKGKTNGKHILIWDCDPIETNESSRWRSVLFGKQRSFIEYLIQKRHMGSASIWYSIDTTLKGRDRCLSYTLKKISDWAQLEDLPYQGPGDTRFINCVKLRA
jgi:hypothetical protein